MNTIPTTFNQHAIPYTLLGGRAFVSKGGGVDAIIMSRGGWYNFSSIVESLTKIGCTSIISLESPNKSLDLERMTYEYPKVKFLILQEKVSIGEGINIAMSEIKGELAIVLWNEQSIVDEKLLLKALSQAKSSKRICTSPLLITKSSELLNTQMLPVLENGHFYTVEAPAIQNGVRTIYAFDFSGIYHRAKFIEFGGFDYTISNSYWQNLDFGFRSYLWGKEIDISTHFKLKYLSSLPVEDTSHDESYTRFYIKNLQPTIKDGRAYIGFDVFFSYLKSMGGNPFNAYRYFKIGRDWVRANEKRFKLSPYELISNWRVLS